MRLRRMNNYNVVEAPRIPLNKRVLNDGKGWISASVGMIFCIILFFFEFFAFSLIPPGLNICSVVVRNAGLTCQRVSYTLSPRLTCYCDGNPIGSNPPASCPANATKVKRPTPITDNYTISCDKRAYRRKNGSHETVYLRYGHYTYTPHNISQPVHRCVARLNMSGVSLTNRNYCGNVGSGLELQAICPYNSNNNQECRDTLMNMIYGRVTFKAGTIVSPDSSCTKKEDTPGNCNFPGGNYYRARNRGGGGGHCEKVVDNICAKDLYNRVTDAKVGSLSVLNNKIDMIVEGTLRDMQCVSDNIKFRNICECNGSDYAFELGEDSTCLCPDGVTIKVDKEGSNCSDTCPANSIVEEDGCRCPCTSGNAQGSFLIPFNSDSCPASAPVNPPLSEGAECNVDILECPTHPNVQSITSRDLCESTETHMVDGGVDYCEIPKDCTDIPGLERDPTGCIDKTVTIDHGECKKSGGKFDFLCKTFHCSDSHSGQGNVYACAVEPNDDGTCPNNSVPMGPGVIGPCNRVVPGSPGDTDSDGWACTTGVAVLGPPEDLDDRGEETCRCMTYSSSPVVYYCFTGSPSTQNSDCKCEEVTTVKTCNSGYSLSAVPGATACDCPDATWTKNGSTCSKPATGSSTTEYRFAMSLPNSDTLEAPIGAMTTTGELRADGWTCAGVPFLSPPRTYCRKEVVLRPCPHGEYDAGPPEVCKTSCTQQASVSACECIKETSTSTCACPDGYIQHGGKCRRSAASSNVNCECECFREEYKNRSFVPGDNVDQGIRADSSICTEIDEGDKEKCGRKEDNCCHQGRKYALGDCPVNHELADGICPCLLPIPNGTPRPASPGGCCPNGKAVVDLKECSSNKGGNPRGVDLVFSYGGPLSFYSVYSIGSAEKPNYICKSAKNHESFPDLFCPPITECYSDLTKTSCLCQDVTGKEVPDTKCDYANIDPMRNEENFLRDLTEPHASTPHTHESKTKLFRSVRVVHP